MQGERVEYSAQYKRLVTLLLMTAYTFNAMDRTIISIIGQPMKVDLKLSDTELGLLGGTAFAALYAFGGIPVARLAERISRVNIITVALLIWSTLSALCGAALNFSQLLLIRVGVGVAEAGCSPPAHSLISDYFEPSRRTSALSIYSCGTSLGYLLAAVAGGYVSQHLGWRAACAMVGLPGIVVAILIKTLVREPPRGHSEPVPQPTAVCTSPRARPASPPFSIREELRELRAVARSLLLDRPILHMILGVTLGAFAAYGFYAFVPPYFSRAFELSYARIGVIAGLTGGVAVGMGIIAGGFVADFLGRRSARWYALVPAIGTLTALPLYCIAMLQLGWKPAAWLLAAAGFFQYASLGPTFGVVQNVVDKRRRATATALLYICLSVLALGGGPLFAGWAIDRFAEIDFRGVDGGMRTGQAASAAAPLVPQRAVEASFAASCPGGNAISSAAGGPQTACRSTLARATRQGMLVTLLFFGWACVHYFLAAIGLQKALQAAAVRNAAAAVN